MKSTLLIDRFGCLQGWEGSHIPIHKRGTIYEANNKECELFIQNDCDVESALSYLTKKEREMLNKGYFITTKNFPSEYFLIQ